ncbi:MAG: tRNA 2-thiocytidine(32) synthetase TtcA [Deltaproteobacteria bacterium]|nr:tRNA 2-thiocytidine(32) synthetase TtcA [Deltaproteobacteria bacterium]
METHVLEARLLNHVGKAIADFGLIKGGDRIMVGISGGKDSYTLLHLLRRLAAKSPEKFEIVAVNLDQGHPGFPAHVLEDYFKAEGVAYKMLKQDTYSIVKRLVPEGKTYCSVCSKLRRGILYTAARELNCNKIALGHHREDLIETLLMSALYSGSLKSMPPFLRSKDGRNVVIRPMCYAPEDEIAEFAKQMAFPIIPCNLCGSQELMRTKVKRLIRDLHAENRQVKGNLLNALTNVVPSHLMDKKLFDVGELRGNDPWLDGDEPEEAEACATPAPEPKLTTLRVP